MGDQHPTFPLDKAEIRRERWRIALASPLTWIPPVAVIVIGMLTKQQDVLILSGLAIVIIALFLFWRAQTRYLEKRVARTLISRSNREQDARFVEQMRALTRSGREGYAITLGKFLELKRGIEAELHADGEAGPAGQNVEALVDGLCNGVGEQFEAIERIERRQAAIGTDGDEFQRLESTRRELLGQVIDGFKALKRTARELSFIVDPAEVARAHQKPARDLDQLVDSLRAEEDIARRTRERLLRDSVGD